MTIEDAHPTKKTSRRSVRHYSSEVTIRFLRPDERLIQSDEQEMPLVIEAKQKKDVPFLRQFLKTHGQAILDDIENVGAVLLRGFSIQSDEDFERAMLALKPYVGIQEAFMSEEGRVPVGQLKYVLHTNAVYKTGGTLYLGGFHSENYYAPDVPSYINFCCLKPSRYGGETGLINMRKIYAHFNEDLKQQLEARPFFVSKWFVKDIAQRYQTTPEDIINVCQRYYLPVVGQGAHSFMYMYKPNVFVNPKNHQSSMQINLFEIPGLNKAMRRCFLSDYSGKQWFWHRLVWRLPEWVLKILEYIYVMIASFSYSPKDSLAIANQKIRMFLASRLSKAHDSFDTTRVGSCFNAQEISQLAKLIRRYYCSCLWQKGDILLVDNKQVMHAGMPGAGPRTVRAMICNPISMRYDLNQTGVVSCETREEMLSALHPFKTVSTSQPNTQID